MYIKNFYKNLSHWINSEDKAIKIIFLTAISCSIVFGIVIGLIIQ